MNSSFPQSSSEAGLAAWARAGGASFRAVQAGPGRCSSAGGGSRWVRRQPQAGLVAGTIERRRRHLAAPRAPGLA
eukprot:5776336-Pleurochrysis_carterae.AAC.2